MWKDTLKKIAAAVRLPVSDSRHKIGPGRRETCGLKEASSHSTISRARDRIDLSEIFNSIVRKANGTGVVKGFILSVDSTQFEAT